MNNNGFRSGALLGGILGASVGMVLMSRVKPMHKRVIKRTAKRAKATLMNGINTLWR
ncbi:MAG: hypothetical protein GXY88_03725 [Tissierellia bacterium]|nr:hypothetical protein [Tissierellia bacterium]